MKISVEDYAIDLKEKVDDLTKNVQEPCTPHEAFAQITMDLLSETDRSAQDPHQIYIPLEGGSYIRGYSYDEELNKLDLFDVSYQVTRNQRPDHKIFLPKEQILKSFEKMLGFVRKLRKYKLKNIDQSMEEKITHIQDIIDRLEQNSIRTISCFFITNVTTRTTGFEARSEKLDETNIVVEYFVYDINKLHKLDGESGDQASEIIIDFTKEPRTPLPFIDISNSSNKFKAYLAYISGDSLSDIYRQYGPIVLEANVRAYLQSRNKTNSKIKKTIISKPDHFIAFNNGLTTTVDSIEYKTVNGQKIITNAKNLQIVNGGQTTASLFEQSKEHPEKLKQINIPIKIIQLPQQNTSSNIPQDYSLSEEEHEKMILEISEASNTQTPIKTSDYRSNSAFHQKFESYSRKTWTPLNNKLTKWFYERTRGQYLVTKNFDTTPSEQRKFEQIYPRTKAGGEMSQLFDKIELAKFHMAYDLAPHIVSKGGDYAYSQYMGGAQELTKEYTDQQWQKYYEDTIAKAILWRKTDKIYTANHKKSLDIRSRVIPYSISYLVWITRGIHLSNIWKIQDLPPEFYEAKKNTDPDGKTLYSGFYPDLIKHVTEQLNNLRDERTVLQSSKNEETWKQLRLTKPSESNLIIPPEILLDEIQDDDVNICESFGENNWNNLIFWAREGKHLNKSKIDIASGILDLLSQKRHPPVTQAAAGVLIIIECDEKGFDSKNISLNDSEDFE